MEAGGAQRLYGLGQLLVSHQHVIGIKSANWQNTDTGVSQRDSHRNENTDKVQIERPLDFDGSPALTGSHIVVNLGIGTDDRELISGSRHGEKAGTSCPLGNWVRGF